MYNHGTAAALTAPTAPRPSSDLTSISDMVKEMGYGELAIALAASDMNTTILRGDQGRDVPTAQLAAWVEQGTERLGGDLAVWQLFQQELQANGRLLGDRETDADRALYRRLWSNKTRERVCRNLGYRLGFALKKTGRSDNWRTVDVPVQVTNDGPGDWSFDVMVRRVRVRDLEMAARERAGRVA